ncbi:MAG: tyrosine-type recombinase/integrase [Giesbergeria sp.]|uniref:tyrosine-type recombinase/integrase n=1 Tax=Giesbergeria sp. TaxID=2818473 RepID=UPI00260800C6|nr:tyrosine-type recombinase/integrase [Giesbergeria sp.]MDD2609881.1 tyrosine-type recombinase/integrase [Giesbergeria sp.]
MPLPTTTQTIHFVRRLGLHHFAYLRAVAEGLPRLDSARRYLGIEHGHQASTAHQQTVDLVRAVARRHAGIGEWRLVGLHIAANSGTSVAAPSLEDFCEQQGLDGWSEAEILEMYADAYPADHRQQRRARLRERQLTMLRRLEALAAEQPLPEDLVTGWFDDATAQRLLWAGINTLGQLHQRIGVGGRWFSVMPGIGSTKAKRIEAHLRNLLPDLPVLAKRLFRLEVASTALAVTNADGLGLLNASSDLQAIESWITARTSSPATVKSYRREAQRLLLWLQAYRDSKPLSTMDVQDCNAYVAFLADIPPDWISRQRASPGTVGWAPFRGPLTLHSRQQAITLVASLFAWLQAARYLPANPWVLVNQAQGDDKEQRLLESKALSEAAMEQVLAYIDRQEASPSRYRIRFILAFISSVGLRSAELIAAKLGDLQHEPEGWLLQVHGKGAKNRLVAIPPAALHALREYLRARGFGDDPALAPTQAPLLSSVQDPMQPIGYQALYEHVRGWVGKAVAAAALPEKERLRLAKASTHWLRHTFGTRAVAKQVPLDVIQAQMGHASIQTTMNTYGRAPIQRRADELGKAFG